MLLVFEQVDNWIKFPIVWSHVWKLEVRRVPHISNVRGEWALREYLFVAPLVLSSEVFSYQLCNVRFHVSLRRTQIVGVSCTLTLPLIVLVVIRSPPQGEWL